ncbi:MAG TPA: ABC transporter substrate-binding protein [Candidatus Limnocylindria bacterium]|jgi:ABC-type branched-subunit amino acid transport system substrate-binding protein
MLRALALALILGACTTANPSVTPTPAPTRDPNAINVTALLDLSGARTPNGGAQRDALQLWADQHASAVPRVRLRIVDVASSPSKTVLELRRAAVEERADAIVIGVGIDYDDAFASAVQLAGVPVLFTLPIPEPATTSGGWAFALAPTPAQLARAVLDDAATRVVLSAAVIVSDESTTAIGERAALQTELVRRRVTPSVLMVTPSDVALKLRPLLPLAPVAILAGTPKTYLEAARSATAGTALYLSYLCDYGDLGELRDAAAFAAWPGTRWIATPAAAGTASAPRVAFVQAFNDRAGPATSVAATAYDALALIAAGAETAADADAMRGRLESGTFAGVATTYSFSRSQHAGFNANDLAILRYVGPRAQPSLRLGV